MLCQLTDSNRHDTTGHSEYGVLRCLRMRFTGVGGGLWNVRSSSGLGRPGYTCFEHRQVIRRPRRVLEYDAEIALQGFLIFQHPRES